MRERTKKKTNWKEVIKKHLRLYFSQEYMHKGQLISWIISDVVFSTFFPQMRVEVENTTKQIYKDKVRFKENIKKEDKVEKN